VNEFKDIKFTGAEEEILSILYSNINSYVSISEIVNKKPERSSYLQDWNYRIHISKIRNKIKPLGYLIKNRYASGYKLEKANA